MSSANPYESPTMHDDDLAQAKSLVLIPAICLLVAASISILLTPFVGFVIVVDSIRMLDEQAGAAEHATVLAFNVSAIVVFISYILVLYGSIQMLKCRRIGMARTAAILSIVPICSPLCVIGIPFGIWALIVTYKPEVQAAFKVNAAQH